MIRKLLIALGVLVALASPASAQIDTYRATRFTLVTGPCTLRSGSGVPSNGMGVQCDLYLDTAAGGLVYRKNATVWVAFLGAGGVLNVAGGGTGASSFTANGVLYGSGTSPLGVTAQGGTNTVLSANSGTPFFTSTPTVTSLTATTSVTSPVLTSGGNNLINPAGDIVTDPVGNDILPVTNFDINIGAPSLMYKSLTVGELIAQTLVAQGVIATIGGRIVVAPTTELTADLAPGGTTITVKHNQMANNDRVFMQSAPGGVPQIEFMSIDSAAGGSAGAYTYTVSRNLDGTGANQWYAGDAVLNTGVTGKGFIDIYSLSGVLSGSGPTIVGNVRTDTPYASVEARWAIGNLNGLYGYGTDLYGAAFGSPSAAWIKIDPTNGVRIGHNATTNISLDASGNASFTGSVTATSGSIGGWSLTPDHLFSGATTTRVGLASGGTGGVAIYAGSETPGSAPFFVMNTGALTATNATIIGTVTAAAGAIGGWNLTSDHLFSGATTTRVGLASGGTGGVAFYAGSETPGSAPFFVMNTGAFTATNATITGAITATSGSFTGTITAAAGAIGGFDIGADYIRDSANTFGLASTVSGGDDVRFFAGASFANRDTAPYRVTESGVVTSRDLAFETVAIVCDGSTINYGLDITAQVVRFTKASGSGSCNIGGIVAPPNNPGSSRVLWVINATGATLGQTVDYATETAVNRITGQTSNPLFLMSGEVGVYIYDRTEERWMSLLSRQP